jgi:fused signal recognition particle receptor
MDELGKIRRVIEKVSPVDEVLLVIDATTGQNGIVQAQTFLEAVSVTGLVLTKLDGTARGGVALAIEASTGLPIKFVGTGEGLHDFAPFDAESFLQSLISG